jgi:uncharacterized Zn finger protein
MSTIDERGIRAMTLLAEGRITDQRSTDGRRLVESSREGSFYLTSEYACTCPDAAYRKATCKHQIAIRLARVLKGAAAENETNATPSNGRVSQIERED